jgi:trehalose synthase
MTIADSENAPVAGAVLVPPELPHIDGLLHVPLRPLSLERYASVLSREQMERILELAAQARELMAGRVIWHVNSTSKGGGVAEMLTALLPYTRGAEVDARWLVIAGDPEFFRITKRIHNHLHGQDGDAPVLSDADREHYESLTRSRAEAMLTLLERDDFVVLHDPQTAGLAPLLSKHCSGVVWRCHVGIDEPNERVRGAWDFLRPYVRSADALIFSRQQFVWEGLEDCVIDIVPPSIDPFSAKNRAMDEATVMAILHAAGLIPSAKPPKEPVEFERQDDSKGRVTHQADVRELRAITPDTRLVVQISRWDRLKDPLGVLEGFRRHVLPRSDADLVLAGPEVVHVADDPEGSAVFAEVEQTWRSLPESERSRVHLVCLPMDDDEENAAMVNALQRCADVVVQKSLAEGFGLTIAEAMWKVRPVVASAVGGIQDQIQDGVNGVLVHDPRDLDSFGDAVLGLLGDRARASAMGKAAQERVRDAFLGTRSMIQYLELLVSLRR